MDKWRENEKNRSREISNCCRQSAKIEIGKKYADVKNKRANFDSQNSKIEIEDQFELISLNEKPCKKNQISNAEPTEGVETVSSTFERMRICNSAPETNVGIEISKGGSKYSKLYFEFFYVDESLINEIYEDKGYDYMLTRAELQELYPKPRKSHYRKISKLEKQAVQSIRESIQVRNKLDYFCTF